MSMLAEKKRREKWSLNPRGKAWSEDQNKFGQRLMEKMGWKSGQGLGANGQGITDIVKTRVKNDSKGLGFKENGEEWLKTTSDFDNLLEELASSREDDSGDGSQTDTPASLEDRSKKSRARVHYHKFTRGKDLSRYSDKDLASIIGPEAIRVKNEPDSKSYYTKNQVNKGSLEDYFSSKSKSKNSHLSDNSVTDNLSDEKDTEECKLILDSNFVPGPEVTVTSIKKEKRRKSKPAEVKTEVVEEKAEVNQSIEDSQNCCIETDESSQETVIPSKKKKKNKSDHDFKTNLNELIENNPNELHLFPFQTSKKGKKNSSMKELEYPAASPACEVDDKMSKKKKRKLEHSPEIKNTISQIQNSAEENFLKKKKQKVEREDMIKTICNSEFSSNDPIDPNEAAANNDIITKKKKIKSKTVKLEQQEDPSERQIDYDYECSDLVPEEEAADNEVMIKKKRKSKIGKKDQEERSPKVQTGCDDECESNNLMVVDDDNVSKGKKKKKLKDENREHKEDSLEEKQSVKGEKHEIKKEDAQLSKENITASGCEQEISHESGDFLEVCGRKTRLKNIKLPRKLPSTDSYQTEDFMSFSNQASFDKEGIKKENPAKQKSGDCMNQYDHSNSTMSKTKKVNQNLETGGPNKNEINVVKSKEGNEKKNENPKNANVIADKCDNNSKTQIFRKMCCKENNEEVNSLKCYAKPNEDDQNVPKHLVAYEYRLVTARLKRLEISPPEVKVIFKESNTLNETTRRKLKQINKIRLLKNLLPPKDVTEIEDSVSKFYGNLKPKIEIMTALSEVEDKISEIATNLDGNADEKEKLIDTKCLLSDKVNVLKNLIEKLEKLLENSRKTEDESGTSRRSVKELSDTEETDDKTEPRLSWLKKVEEKLDVLKKHMKMLAEGKKPPGLNINKESQPPVKTKQVLKYNSKYFQNSSYSRGRIAHNVGIKRGRGRGQTAVRTAVPSGGWGILKSYGSGKEPVLPESQGFKGGSSDAEGRGGFGDRGGFMGRGRSSYAEGYMKRGRGRFGGRGGFAERGRGSGDAGHFMGRGRSFRGQGRGRFRGRGRGDTQVRGRISQTNMEAKQYAQQCRELNQIPSVCFNGVNMSVISGYPAKKVDVDKISASRNLDSKSLSNHKHITGLPEADTKRKSISADATKTVPGGFSEIIMEKVS